MRPLPFVLAASDHGPMIVNRLDYHQLPTGDTYGVGHQILSTGSYDQSEIDFVLSTLSDLRAEHRDGVIAIDCGANIGVHTLEMARLMQGWGRVVAFEAQERLYYALCGNVALVNLFNVTAIHAAVGATDGTISIPQPNYNKAASFGSLEFRRTPSTEYIGQSVSYAARDSVEVRLMKIDSLSLARLDFIKIDVEGMEMDVLHGAAESITKFHPTMLIEWIKIDRAELIDFLSTYDYTFEERGANIFATKSQSIK